MYYFIYDKDYSDPMGRHGIVNDADGTSNFGESFDVALNEYLNKALRIDNFHSLNHYLEWLNEQENTKVKVVCTISDLANVKDDYPELFL
jgi:hypothetical protein